VSTSKTINFTSDLSCLRQLPCIYFCCYHLNVCNFQQAMQQFEWHDGSMKNIHVDVAMVYEYQVGVTKKSCMMWRFCNSHEMPQLDLRRRERDISCSGFASGKVCNLHTLKSLKRCRNYKVMLALAFFRHRSTLFVQIRFVLIAFYESSVKW